MASIPWVLFVCYCCLHPLLLGVHGKPDYYEVLGVSPSASYKDIRSSYKRLAREWHPDKNRSPNAAQRFMEIKEAYEVLSDERERRRYDSRGSDFFGFGDPFNIVITPFSRRRTVKPRDDVINSDFFFNTVLPASHTKPYLLYFYSDFDCFLCLNMDSVWSRLKKEPTMSGVGMATISTRTMDVFDFVGVVEVPAIVSVFDEHFYYYQHIYHPSVTGLTHFITATLLGSSLFTTVNSDNLVSFLGLAVTANKPRLIIVSSKPHPQLHHLLVAITLRSFIAFGFISTAKGRNAPLAQDLGVPLNEEMCVVFKENAQDAVGRSSTASSELAHFAKRHTLLDLPRLSSPEHFKAVCSKRQSSGCLVLVVSGTTQYTSNRADTWRSLHTSAPKAYVDASWQSAFLQRLNCTPVTSITCEDGDSAWKVLAFKWRQQSVLSYAWMEWCPEMRPESLVADQWITVEGGGGEDDPSHLIIDENGPGFLQRLWLRCEAWFMRSVTSLKAFALSYPQILVSAFMMVPLLCLLTLKQGAPLPDLRQQMVDRQDDDFLGFSDSSAEESELEDD